MTRSVRKTLEAAGIALAILPGMATAQSIETDLPFSVIVSEYTDDREAALDIARARNEWREAFSAMDVEKIMSFYADDIYSFDMMAQPGPDKPEMAFDGYQEWFDNWVYFADLFEDDFDVELGELTVYQSGDMATIQHLTYIGGTMKGDGEFFEMWARDTNVMRLVDGEWLVVHDHVSVPIDFDTGRGLIDLTPRS